MIVGDLGLLEVTNLLRSSGLRFRTGAFNCRVTTSALEIAPELMKLYQYHPLLKSGDFIDFHVSVDGGTGVRRWIRPQAKFVVDGVEPFSPLPRAQALPMLEWGLNWCITAYCHHVLIIHAAALAKNDRALILPAPPGSGKSTLCAALVNRGWRLLSDELTIVRLDTGEIQGLARPVSLKNESIDVIGRFAPDAFLSQSVRDTTKGTVALMAPPVASVQSMDIGAIPRWVVLPKYSAGAKSSLVHMPSGEVFMKIADNAMNYHVLGLKGFDAVGSMVDRCRHFSFEYSDLNEAIAIMDSLAADA